VKRLCLLLLIGFPCLAAVPGENCKALRRHGQMNQAKACFTALLRGDAFARAEGLWGTDRFEAANDEFKLAEKNAPRSPELKTEWGLLYLEHYQPGDAATQ